MKRIDRPQNARSRRTRAGILDAVWALIEERGAERLTMDEIADRAGTTRRTVYMHFGSRTELLLGLFEHMNATLDVDAALAPIERATTGADALAAWATFVADFHSRILPVARAIDRARRTDRDAQAMWDHAMAGWHHGCRALARRLEAEGLLARPWTPATAADLLWSLMSVEMIEDLVHDRGWSLQAYAEALTTIAQRTLLST